MKIKIPDLQKWIIIYFTIKAIGPYSLNSLSQAGSGSYGNQSNIGTRFTKRLMIEAPYQIDNHAAWILFFVSKQCPSEWQKLAAKSGSGIRETEIQGANMALQASLFGSWDSYYTTPILPQATPLICPAPHTPEVLLPGCVHVCVFAFPS